MARFSIIIPIYNVAPYLRKCLDSVLAQTFTDWEAVCVDDGSTDGSGATLDEYAAKDKRFVVVHQQNAGVGEARNNGLKNAKGEWVLFLDADDVLHKDCLAELSLHQLGDVDLMLFKYKNIGEGETIGGELVCHGVNILSLQKIDWHVFFHPIFAASFRASKYKNARFQRLTIGEDRLWYVSALDSANKAAVLDYIGYGYRIRVGSAIHSKMTLRKFNDNLQHFALLLTMMQKSSKLYSVAVLRRVAQSITEYAAMEYVQLLKGCRDNAFVVWMNVLRSAGVVPILSSAQRFRMRVCSYFNKPFIALVLCYLPYWLKSHGVHR